MKLCLRSWNFSIFIYFPSFIFYLFPFFSLDEARVGLCCIFTFLPPDCSKTSQKIAYINLLKFPKNSLENRQQKMNTFSLKSLLILIFNYQGRRHSGCHKCLGTRRDLALGPSLKYSKIFIMNDGLELTKRGKFSKRSTLESNWILKYVLLKFDFSITPLRKIYVVSFQLCSLNASGRGKSLFQAGNLIFQWN